MTESAIAPRGRSALAPLVDLHPSLHAFLQETTHWAKDLPLPDQVAIEIIHTASTQRIYKAQCSTFSVQLIPGGSIGLYVGETYKLRVLEGSHVVRILVGQIRVNHLGVRVTRVNSFMRRRKREFTFQRFTRTFVYA